MKIKILTLSALLSLSLVQATSAAVPLVNMVCGADIEVHADEGGPVYVNGEEAALKAFNDSYYEAKSGAITVSISIDADGSADLSYTGAGGVNGICQPALDEETAGTSGTIPSFNAECPTGLSVHADEGGAVYVNGEEAEVTFFSTEYFEAKRGEAVISVSTNADDTLDVSYTAGSANGICKLD